MNTYRTIGRMAVLAVMFSTVSLRGVRGINDLINGQAVQQPYIKPMNISLSGTSNFPANHWVALGGKFIATDAENAAIVQKKIEALQNNIETAQKDAASSKIKLNASSAEVARLTAALAVAQQQRAENQQRLVKQVVAKPVPVVAKKKAAAKKKKISKKNNNKKNNRVRRVKKKSARIRKVIRKKRKES